MYMRIEKKEKNNKKLSDYCNENKITVFFI